jgi:hypothetical protein
VRDPARRDVPDSTRVSRQSEHRLDAAGQLGRRRGASAAILTTLKLEQDLGALTTAELHELMAVVTRSAARARPARAFVDTAGTEPPTAEFDPIEFGRTQSRATDDVLSPPLSRAVREIYDADPDAAG